MGRLVVEGKGQTRGREIDLLVRADKTDHLPQQTGRMHQLRQVRSVEVDPLEEA